VATFPECGLSAPAGECSRLSKAAGSTHSDITVIRAAACAQMALRKDAVLQTLSDTLVSLFVVVMALAGVLLILLPFAMAFGVVV